MAKILLAITSSVYAENNISWPEPGYFVNLRHETVKIGVPLGNRRMRDPRTPGRTVISAVVVADS
jgi:hypothetical protein